MLAVLVGCQPSAVPLDFAKVVDAVCSWLVGENRGNEDEFGDIEG